jgi:hypothetical protein
MSTEKLSNVADLEKILRFDQPYNLAEILRGLTEAADILLHA